MPVKRNYVYFFISNTYPSECVSTVTAREIDTSTLVTTTFGVKSCSHMAGHTQKKISVV